MTIKYLKLGWYHPSNANWSYQIWLITDDTGARMYRSTFGGEYRMEAKMTKENKKIEKLHAGVGSDTEYKWASVRNLPDIEEYEGENWKK